MEYWRFTTNNTGCYWKTTVNPALYLLKMIIGFTNKKIVSGSQTNNSNNNKIPRPVCFFYYFVFDLRWLNDFIFSYKHYINSHAKTQDHICRISTGQNPTCESGHSRSNPKCCLTFPIVDIMVILWDISRAPDLSNTTVCHESIPEQGANALWHLNMANDFIHEDKTPLHEATTHRYALVPAL